MSEHYPRIRLYSEIDGERYLRIRESVSITFYMMRKHSEIRDRVAHALEAYRCAAGPRALEWYYDDEGDPHEVRTCPATCDVLTADPAGSIGILFGCETQIDIPE